MESNMLLVKVLDMLAILVKYGYYDSKEDVNEILKRLVSILNGFTDLPDLPSPTETGTSAHTCTSRVKYIACSKSSCL